MGAAHAKHDKDAVWEERMRYRRMSPDSKRRHYFCGGRYVSTDHITTWEQYFMDNIDTTPHQTYRYKVNTQINNQVALWSGDITECELDAIVNSVCNQKNKPGSVSRCIMERAGEYCQDELIYKGLPNPGMCNVIGGYKLPAKYVINTMAPSGRDEDTLIECYTNALEAAVGHGLRTIAFPCLATNKFRGFPNEAACHVALASVRDWLEENTDKMDMVVFCVFNEKDKVIYEKLMQTYFPLEANRRTQDGQPSLGQSAQTGQSTQAGQGGAGEEEEENPEVDALQRILFVNHILGQLGQPHVMVRIRPDSDTQSCPSSHTQGSGQDTATTDISNDTDAVNATPAVPLAQWQDSTKQPYRVQWIAVNRSETTPILKRLLPIYENPTIDLQKRPFIRYEDEEGLDLGALSRDFFYKSMEALTQGQVGAAPAFEGDVSQRLPCASKAHSQNGVFELVGKVLAHSTLHGGVGIVGLSPAVVFLLSHPADKSEVDVSGIPLTLEDLPDVELLELLRKADKMSEMSDTDRQKTHHDLLVAMERCNYGYTPINSSTLPAIQQELLLYEVIYKRWEQILELRAGMEVLGLYSFLCQNPSQANLTKVFPRPQDVVITAADIKAKLNPPYSNHTSFTFLIKLLDELQGSIEHLSLCDLVAFWTGTPILTTDPLNLSVSSGMTLPVAHCCFNKLELPGALTAYGDFRDKFILALNEGNEGFNIE